MVERDNCWACRDGEMKATVAILGLVCVVSLAINGVQWRQHRAYAETAAEPWRAEIKRLKADQEARAAREAAAAKAQWQKEVSAARVAAQGPTLAGFKPASEWNEAGNQTPGFALETHCWAIENHDPKVLLTTLHLTSAQRSELAGYFERLSADERARYGSPEMMLAICWANTELNFTAFRLQSEEVHFSNSIALKAQLQGPGAVEARLIYFYRDAEGWKREVPPNIMQGMLRRGGIVP